MNVMISEVSTDNDIAEILDWLKREKESEGQSFYCNRDIIEKAHREGKMFVLRKDDKAIAFVTECLLTTDAILAVDPDRRKHGYGKRLVRYCVGAARANDRSFLHIQCSASIPFWKKMGFKLFPERSSSAPYAYMILPRRFDLPADCKEASVCIGFYKDGASRHSSAEPLTEHRPRACWLNDKQIVLEERVMGFCLSGSSDIVVKIDVGGETLYFGRAKYDEQFGVQRDGPLFYLDVITLQR